MAEPCERCPRGAKRRQSLLEAAGGAAAPAVRGQLRQGLGRTPRVCTLPQATRAQPLGRGRAGPPESSGRGRQEERRRRPWEAPAAPAGANDGVWSPAPRHGRGNPAPEPGGTLRPVVAHVPGRGRSTGRGQAHRRRWGSRSERRTPRWGKPTTGGRSRRKHAARQGHASRTGRTGSVCANLPAGHSKKGGAR